MMLCVQILHTSNEGRSLRPPCTKFSTSCNKSALIAKQNVFFYDDFAHSTVCSNKTLITVVADNRRFVLVTGCLLLAVRKIVPFVHSQ